MTEIKSNQTEFGNSVEMQSSDIINGYRGRGLPHECRCLDFYPHIKKKKIKNFIIKVKNLQFIKYVKIILIY